MRLWERSWAASLVYQGDYLNFPPREQKLSQNTETLCEQTSTLLLSIGVRSTKVLLIKCIWSSASAHIYNRKRFVSLLVSPKVDAWSALKEMNVVIHQGGKGCRIISNIIFKGIWHMRAYQHKCFISTVKHGGGRVMGWAVGAGGDCRYVAARADYELWRITKIFYSQIRRHLLDS